MLIKSRMGLSADGFVSTPEGVPAIAVAPGFESGGSHGVPVAAGALLALGQGAATIEATMSVPCYAAAAIPSQVWPAADCPLCVTRIPLITPPSS